MKYRDNSTPSKNRNQFVGEVNTYPVTQSDELLAFLLKTLTNKSRTTVKSHLSHRQVYINNRVSTKFDALLRPGDEVSIKTGKGFNECKSIMLRIVFEDDYIIVIDKKYGLLSIATDRVKEKTAFHILSEHVKSNDIREKVFVVHRLDRETSGLMMFAKSEKVQEELQQNWEEAVIKRNYLAVVEGVPTKKEGTVTSYLCESSALKVYPTTPENGKLAITHYQVIKTNGTYTLVELDLETGRKNQIRVQMQEIGNPIAGDKKYGGHPTPVNRVALHASRLHFIHPVSGKEMDFESPTPQKFLTLLKKEFAAQK